MFQWEKGVPLRVVKMSPACLLHTEEQNVKQCDARVKCLSNYRYVRKNIFRQDRSIQRNRDMLDHGSLKRYFVILNKYVEVVRR